MGDRVRVLIFTHSQTISSHERVSLAQCGKVLAGHPIDLVCPDGLDVAAYLEAVPALNVVRVGKRWLSSYADYNRLKMQSYLYRLYSSVEFLLTYELDAFVFRDELLKWCDAGYDYIGAPWFEGYAAAPKDARVLGVGNSGFSLRRTSAALRALDQMGRLHNSRVAHIAEWRACRRRSRAPVRELMARLIDPSAYPCCEVGNEDVFWCRQVATQCPWFRVAEYSVARHFSFEVNPSRLYAECEASLPFGCHKWAVYEYQFWRPHIEAFGHVFPA